MSGDSVSVLLVDDDRLTRSGMCALLASEPALHVVGEADDGTQVLPMVDRLRPDVVLMDVRMPRLNGIQATRLLQKQCVEPPKVLVITTFDSDAHVYDALRAGAAGFLLKRARASELVHAIHLVATGDILLFPEAVRRLAASHVPGTDRTPATHLGLSERETQILRLIATGRSNQQIATTLVIGSETVKTHVSNILTKLDASNRTQAVIIAYESGLVTPNARPAP